MTPLAALFMGFFAFSTAVPSEGLAAEPSRDACGVAVHIVSEAIRQFPTATGWVVDDPHYLTSEEAKSLAEDRTVARVEVPSPESLRKLWKGTRPGRGLKEAPDPPIDQRVTECESLRSVFSGMGVEFGRPGRERSDAIVDRGEQGPAVIEVSTPVIAADGKQAMATVSLSASGGGHGEVLHFKRTRSGEWKTVGRLRLWVS